jgi:beta-glucosidase
MPQAPHSADTTMKCEDVVAPLDSITGRAAQNGASVTFDPGTDPAAAAKAAAGADVAVVFGYQKTGEFADLPDLHLQGGGDALISAVARANKNTVVVLETGSAVEMPWLDQVRGVVEAWYPGEQQGPALAALLFGDAGFSGHLPMTFPKSVADVPTRTPQQYPGVVDASKIRQVQYSEGLAIGYRWYQQQEISPLFAFGYGLSYTSFSYSELRVSSHSVRFEIRNTGHRTGTATPQAYLTVAGEPGKRLAAFDRVTLAPGASTTVQLAIPSGGTLVSVGSSAEDLPLHAQR